MYNIINIYTAKIEKIDLFWQRTFTYFTLIGATFRNFINEGLL